MSYLYQLIKLQNLDHTIAEDKNKLGKILHAKQDPSELVELRNAVDTLRQKIQKLKTRLKDEELELGSVSDKLNQNQQKMYSGKVKNPKTLQDLELESESLGRRQTVLEDQMLETMTVLETDELQYDEQHAALTAQEEAWRQTHADLENQQRDVALRLNEYLSERTKQTAKIEANLLKEYEHLLKSKKGLAVCPVSYEMCQGCRVTVNNAVIRAIDHGEIVNCPNCQRILYLPHP
ncbi:MAG: C4-type zinc ribbon domain-containing protein [Ardenticatenaceae bacterium]|nr:C4-type zinc ribbon domain-containing protein [Ardenticatenaceae bacterium]